MRRSVSQHTYRGNLPLASQYSESKASALGFFFVFVLLFRRISRGTWRQSCEEFSHDLLQNDKIIQTQIRQFTLSRYTYYALYYAPSLLPISHTLAAQMVTRHSIISQQFMFHARACRHPRRSHSIWIWVSKNARNHSMIVRRRRRERDEGGRGGGELQTTNRKLCHGTKSPIISISKWQSCLRNRHADDSQW